VTDKERIDYAASMAVIRQADTRPVLRQNDAAAYERNPSYQQKQAEREGRSEWSGGNMGGGTWGGRARGEREQA
jgi:hypothetical protein